MKVLNERLDLTLPIHFDIHYQSVGDGVNEGVAKIHAYAESLDDDTCIGTIKFTTVDIFADTVYDAYTRMDLLGQTYAYQVLFKPDSDDLVFDHENTIYVRGLLVLDEIFLKERYRGNKVLREVLNNFVKALHCDNDWLPVLRPYPLQHKEKVFSVNPEQLKLDTDKLISYYRSIGFVFYKGVMFNPYYLDFSGDMQDWESL